MDGFWSSFSKWFNEKTSSPLYFTYSTFFVIWNWKFFQVIFLESESLFNTPRIEYVDSKLLFNLSSSWLPQWLDNLLNGPLNAAWHIVPPVIFTYLAIVYLPRLHSWAFGIYLKNYFNRKKEYREAELEYEKGKTVILKEEAKEKGEQAKQIKIIKTHQTKEDVWDKEFINFTNNKLFSKIQQLINTIYNQSGMTKVYNSNRGIYERIIESDFLAIAHAKGLINITGEGNKEKITLTDKGIFFVEKYLEKH